MHFHIGYNMPGYLPENDESAYSYETADAAKRAMIDILDRNADHEQSWVDPHDCDDTCPTYGDSCGWQIANNLSADMEDLNLANVSDGWGTYQGNLHYWISPCAEEHEEDEYSDY